jgi:hypothetical protein
MTKYTSYDYNTNKIIRYDNKLDKLRNDLKNARQLNQEQKDNIYKKYGSLRTAAIENQRLTAQNIQRLKDDIKLERKSIKKRV